MSRTLLARSITPLLLAVAVAACGGDDADTVGADDTTTASTSGSTAPRDTSGQPTAVVPDGGDSAPSPSRGSMERPVVTPAEESKIDAWLAAYADSLNDYGDAEGTMYAGGTPLSNEAQGKPVTKYEYIVAKHPEKPWNAPLPKGRPSAPAKEKKSEEDGE